MKDFIIGIIGLGALLLSVTMRIVGPAFVTIAILAVILGAGSDVGEHLAANVTHAPGDDLWQRLVNIFWALTGVWQAVVLVCVFFWTLNIRRN